MRLGFRGPAGDFNGIRDSESSESVSVASRSGIFQGVFMVRKKQSLIACPDCGSEISRLAVACPKCGRAGSQGGTASQIIKLIAVLVVLGFGIFSLIDVLK